MIHPVQIVRNWRSRLRLLDRMEIDPTDVVLEVGSGQNPNPRANVLCDRHLLDDTERNLEPVQIDRPFVVGDIYRLPFLDQSFDYVICSHVLEHLEDPEAACRELARVAPRGYVETPSRVNEKLRSYPFHRWTVTEENGVLRFEEKSRPILDPELQAWFERLGQIVPDFGDLYLRNLHELGNVVSLVWADGPEIEVVRHRAGSGSRVGGDEKGFTGATSGHEDLAAEAEQIRRLLGRRRRRRWKRRVESLLARTLRRHSDPGLDLGARIACPACVVPLHAESERMTCPRCDRSYPRIPGPDGRGIPFLVAPGPKRS